MIDLRKTVIPKSDQLNADDLIGQTRTIKVTKVSLLEAADQPIAIGFEGDDGKPYKPCKSMRRVMVHTWGPDGNAYIGRSMTIYRDDKVTFGGANVGGIRISHMSHIDGPVTMALTATRASRKPFTVQPLAAPTPTPTRSPNGVPADVLAVRDLGDEAAAAGMDALRKFWDGLSKAGRVAVGGAAQLAAWKVIAEAADAPDVDFDDAGSAEDNHSPAPSEAPEPAGGVPPGPAEATPQGPLEGAAVSAPGAAAPSNPDADSKARVVARVAEIRKDGDARAAAGMAALLNYFEQLAENGESHLVSPTLRASWHEAAKVADAKGRKA